MAIDDHSSLAFELILQPSALNEKLLSRQSKAGAGDYFKKLLQGFIAVAIAIVMKIRD